MVFLHFQAEGFRSMTAGQNIQNEIWRGVVGAPHYLVSSWGHVKSLPRVVERVGMKGGALTIPGKLMTPTPNKGYPRYTLRVDGKTVYRFAHQLVAEAFIGPVPPGQEVRHKNDDRSNPRLDNLEYGTRAQNIADCKRNGGYRNGASHLTEKLVREIHGRGNETAASLAVKYAVSPSTIESILVGRGWKHLGLEPYKSRMRKGASHPRPLAKITDADALDIFRSPLTTKELAFLYGISPQTILGIKNGYVWNHVTGLEKPSRCPTA
jgi:hypothetical protein